MQPLIPEKTLRERIGVSATTWWSWRQKNRTPPAIKIGRRRYYSDDAVTNWLQELQEQVEQHKTNPKDLLE